MLRNFVILIINVLVDCGCYSYWWSEIGTLTFNIDYLLVLLSFMFICFDKLLGIEEMKNHWKNRADTITSVSLPQKATFDSKSKILTSTFESIVCASEVKTMQETWFVLSDTKSAMTSFKSQLFGMIIVNIFLILILLAGNIASVGAQSVTVNFDIHAVVAVAIVLAQLSWQLRLLHVLYQRNQSHLARINGL